MSSSCAGDTVFTVSSLAKRMHDFPHRTRDFKTVDNTFDPINTEYLEGAAFSAGVFLLVGIILFAFILLYLFVCACCCKGSDDDSEKRPGCHWVFLVVCCGLCGVGLILGYYGNEDTKKGIVNAADAIIRSNSTVSDASSKVGMITDELVTSNAALGRLKASWQNVTNPVARAELIMQTDNSIRAVSQAHTQAGDIDGQLNNVADVAKYADDMKKYDKWRWQGTIAALCFIILLLLLVVLALIFNSPFLLKLVVFLATISLLLMFLAAGVFVAVGVLGGDFCVDPNGYVNRVTKNETFEDTLRYFVYCGNCSNPFQSDYDGALEEIDKAQNGAMLLYEAAVNFSLSNAEEESRVLNSSLARAERSLMSVWENEINCQSIHNEYNSILTAVCSKTLDGTIFTFAGALIIGFSLCLLIMSAQGYWKRLQLEDFSY